MFFYKKYYKLFKKESNLFFFIDISPDFGNL